MVAVLRHGHSSPKLKKYSAKHEKAEHRLFAQEVVWTAAAALLALALIRLVYPYASPDTLKFGPSFRWDRSPINFNVRIV